MEALPKIVRQRLRPQGKPGVHPRADLLTAFAEKSLTERERTRVIEHLSRCEDCREVVFLSGPQPDPVQIVGRVPNRGGWLSWPPLRWGAAVACVVIVGTAVTLFREGPHHPDLLERAASKTAGNANRSALPASATASANRGVTAEKISEPAAKEYTSGKEMAKAEPPVRPNRKAMTAIPRMPMQFDQSREINGNDVEATRSLSDADASNMAAAPTSATVNADANFAYQPGRDKKQAQTLAPDLMNQTARVQVESGSATAAQSNESPATDLQPKSYSANSAQVSGAIGGQGTRGLADPMKMKMDSTSATLTARWKLTPAGTLQRSQDAGDHWDNVPVAGNTTFQALAALLADVWVGGANGLLYHSSDSGLHWAQVVPKSGDESLSGGITHIEFGDVQNGKITTTSGEGWTTSDAGKSWRKN